MLSTDVVLSISGLPKHAFSSHTLLAESSLRCGARVDWGSSNINRLALKSNCIVDRGRSLASSPNGCSNWPQINVTLQIPQIGIMQIKAATYSLGITMVATIGVMS